MGKYIGITVVLILGIASIGMAAYQANLLQEELLANASAAKRAATLPIHHERSAISLGSFSFVPLVPQESLLAISGLKAASTTLTAASTTPLKVATTTRSKPTPAKTSTTAPATTTSFKAPTPTVVVAPPVMVATPPASAPTQAPAPTAPTASSKLQWGVFAGDSNDN